MPELYFKELLTKNCSISIIIALWQKFMGRKDHIATEEIKATFIREGLGDRSLW